MSADTSIHQQNRRWRRRRDHPLLETHVLPSSKIRSLWKGILCILRTVQRFIRFSLMSCCSKNEERYISLRHGRKIHPSRRQYKFWTGFLGVSSLDHRPMGLLGSSESISTDVLLLVPYITSYITSYSSIVLFTLHRNN